jgi:hypothetical protein
METATSYVERQLLREKAAYKELSKQCSLANDLITELKNKIAFQENVIADMAEQLAAKQGEIDFLKTA